MTKKNNLVLSTEIEKEQASEPKLKFLSQFMMQCGECASDIARATGLTRGGVSHWFVTDDCKLSYCEKYINIKGYDLVIELKKQKKAPTSKVNINIERRTPDIDDAGCRRLLFILTALAKEGVTKVQLAKDMELKYNTVRHWFIVDDIYVSHIFRIADLYGLEINIDIKPQNKES